MHVRPCHLPLCSTAPVRRLALAAAPLSPMAVLCSPIRPIRPPTHPPIPTHPNPPTLPRYLQAACCDDDWQSFHCEVPRSMALASIDPSLALGFYCGSLGEAGHPHSLLPLLPVAFSVQAGLL